MELSEKKEEITRKKRSREEVGRRKSELKNISKENLRNILE